MTHPDLDLLTSDAHELTTPEERVRLSEHLAACPECAETLARLHSERARLELALEAAPAAAPRFRSALTAAAAAALLAAGTMWLALRPSSTPGTPAADPVALIAQLGSADAKIRARAASELMRLGDQARPILEEALRSDDPTLRSSARSLLTVLDGREAPEDADDVPDVQAQDLMAEGDRDKRYFLLSRRRDATTVPTGGFPLVVMLPGGDGGLGMHPFAKRVVEHALPSGWIAAQLVAVAWKRDSKIVWPTREDPEPGARFTTEDFVAAVVRDVAARTTVDPSRVFVLGWYSGGPAAYAVATGDFGVRGALVSMSVFKLKSLEGAKGRSFYVDHVRGASSIPLTVAEAGRDALTGAGATVRLETFEGAWTAGIYERLRQGLTWLGGSR